MCSNSYTKVDKAILDDDKLPRSCKAVFIVLCRHAHNDDRSCWLCIKTIAKESSYSIRTVKGAIKKLVEAGLITRQDRFSEEDGGQISSLFTIIGKSAKRYEDTPPVQKLHAPQCNDCTHNKSFAEISLALPLTGMIPLGCCTGMGSSSPEIMQRDWNDSAFNAR